MNMALRKRLSHLLYKMFSQSQMALNRYLQITFSFLLALQPLASDKSCRLHVFSQDETHDLIPNRRQKTQGLPGQMSEMSLGEDTQQGVPSGFPC